MAKKRKTGKFATAEIEQIRNLTAAGTSIADIAKQLNRQEATIIRAMRRHNIVHGEMGKHSQDLTEMRTKLHGRDYWAEIQAQFSSDELKYFEYMWLELMLQFRGDVLFAEELQIKQLITLEVLMNRNMRMRKEHIEEVEKLKSNLAKEYAVSKDNRDVARITNLETQLSYAKGAVGTYSTEYSKLLDKHQAMQKDLKSTRDQRIKRVEDNQSTFLDCIKAIDDDEKRQRLGIEAELLATAADKAKEKLVEWHTYLDDKLDQPILESSTARVE